MIFAPTNPDKIAAHQLYEARRLLLEHPAAAEYHSSMATMLEGRIDRLTPIQQPKKENAS